MAAEVATVIMSFCIVNSNEMIMSHDIDCRVVAAADGTVTDGAEGPGAVSESRGASLRCFTSGLNSI